MAVKYWFLFVVLFGSALTLSLRSKWDVCLCIYWAKTRMFMSILSEKKTHTKFLSISIYGPMEFKVTTDTCAEFIVEFLS